MVLWSVVACAALFALAATTNVGQCPGKAAIPNLKENVQLSPCMKTPCKLKKGHNQNVSIAFTPDEDLGKLYNHVKADIGLGIDLPFVGVDGNSICDKIFTKDGNKASCPLKAGTEYKYEDFFPVLSIYPTLPSVTIKWSLSNSEDSNGKEITCFTVPAKIVS